jgi:tripartite-type tricarboxylate transporter receptor subunit TctC
MKFLQKIIGISACVFAFSGMAQSSYPDKPIRLVVGYPPGGSVDFTGRLIGEALASRLKVAVVIENQGGAAGTIAALRVSQAPADGYTLLLGSSNELAGTGVVNPQQKYDPSKDFTHIGLIATAPVLFVAGSKAPVKTFDEFVKLAKANPGKFSYGTSGVGSSLHFAGEMLKSKAGVFMTHIPYRGVAPLTNDLIGGGIEFAMLSVPAAKAQMASGRITVLGVTSAKRLPALPQVAPLADHPLFRSYNMNGWFALVGPKALPADVTQKLQEALRSALADPAVQSKMEDGGNIIATGRESLAKVISDEVALLKAISQFANMKE